MAEISIRPNRENIPARAPRANSINSLPALLNNASSTRSQKLRSKKNFSKTAAAGSKPFKANSGDCEYAQMGRPKIKARRSLHESQREKARRT